MPPGHHSSSSHHSSHSHSSSHRSSSSHHSSSHSSSHRSSSYSSSHRSSSYSGSSRSSHSSSSYGSSRYSSGGANSSNERRIPRNQPTGYPSNVPGYTAPSHHWCRMHNYTYYSRAWTDSSIGKEYSSGYYDEEGNYYKHLVIKKYNSYTTQCECDYCGTSVKLEWYAGALPSCPNCGASLNVMEQAAVDEQASTDSYEETATSKQIRTFFLVILFFTCVIGPFVMIMRFVPLLIFHNGSSSSSSTSSERYYDERASIPVDLNVELWGESIYVESIGRTITWSDEYESYYDSESDCYVYYNMDQNPYVWQYWYEDISSDYGDYGWMEYELAEDQWYIEKGTNDWEPLPSKYDEDKLWHFGIEQAGESYMGLDNTYLFGESLTIDGYDFEWMDVSWTYYNEELDCYISYNTDVYPFIWQYYYNSISGTDDFKGFGWMEYEADENQWYIDSEEGWIELPEKYDGDSLWHIETEPEYIINE